MSLRPVRVLAAAFVVSTVSVAVAIPLRWEVHRPLSTADVHPEVLTGRRVSFASHHVWRYALIEILVLTLVLVGICLAVARTGLAFTLPILLVAEVCLVFFVAWYSPAWWDADLFHQRILVDGLTGWGLLLVWLFYPAVVYPALLASIAVYLLQNRRRLFSRDPRTSDSIPGGP